MRCLKIGFLCLVTLMIQGSSRAQTIQARVYVAVSFTVVLPSVPGDPPETIYENSLGDVSLDMDGGGGAAGRRWQVTVNKSTSAWNSNLQLDVLRDSARTDVIDGSSYITVPDSPSSIYFFQTNNTRRVRNLDIQHRVTINDPTISAGTYTTTITYTIARY